MTQPDPRRQAPIEHRVAPEAAARFATAPRPAGPAPTAAASLRRRIDGRRVQARAGGVRRHVIGTAVPAALAVTGLVVFAAGGPPVSSVLVVLLLVAVGVAGEVWWARALLGFDAPTRELRRRVSAEVRTARALDPLESAGWVLLHDRLVANERVPHVLVGPPGAVVLHPHSFGRLAPLRAVARRVLRLGRRPVPSLTEPAELGNPVALRTRDNLLGVLTHEPDLAGWYVVVHAVTPVLDLPADRALFSATAVVHRGRRPRAAPHPGDRAARRAQPHRRRLPRQHRRPRLPPGMTRTPTVALAAALAVTAVLLAGCGPATTAAAPTTAPAAGSTAPSGAPGTSTPADAASSPAPAPRGGPTITPAPTAAPPASGGVLPVEDPDHSTAQPFPAAGSCHARPVPNGTLPDPACTPGATDPHVTQATIGTTICRAGGYTSTVRPPEAVTSVEKRSALRSYNDTAPTSTYELDHLVSLELGGSPNSPHNLWPEPGASPNPKDKLEGALHDLVCSHRMTLTDAQNAIAGDWVTTYRQVLGAAPAG